MKTAIILHGMPSKKNYYSSSANSQSNCHWIPWLQQQLTIKDILTQTPEMPVSYAPNYGKWLQIFSQFDVNEDTILIGHSCGAGFLTKWLTLNQAQVNKVILVAPWIDPNQAEEMFKDFKFGKDLVEKTVSGITIFNSDNDAEEVQNSSRIIKEANPNILFKEFHNYGHFCYRDLPSNEFPELLEEALDH
ncbi:MAG: alpha/beta hydrolase [Actinomycetota bacterium]